jgi:Mn2+/Fe2+ NRAMP family transporter
VGPVLRYNLYRLGLLVAFLAAGYLLGAGGLVLVVVAVLASGIASYFLLARQRAAMVTALQAKVAARQARTAAKEAREDEYDEQLRQGRPQG